MSKCRVYDLGRISYGEALLLQQRAVSMLQKALGDETLFLLEHPHVITFGRNATTNSLLCERASLKEKGIDIVDTDRGGDVTYHGPGQLVGYPIFKLESEEQDVRKYVNDIELALIRILADFNIPANRQLPHRGVWTRGRKIASVGIRISRWVTCHGFALNVNTDLSYFSLIHPCGITGCRMTSMQQELGASLSMNAVKASVIKWLSDIFGRELVHGDFSDEIKVCIE